MDLKKYIEKVLLENAIAHGSARPQAAVGAVMREFPQQRGNAKEVIAIAKPIAQEINKLNTKDQETRLQKLGGSDAPEEEERDPFDLEHPSPILRFEPSVSGPMHIGHTYPLGLNHLLAIRNKGKLILRIADTNPDNIYEPAYELLEKDANWYTHNNISEVIVQSERMELYYAYAEKMLKEGWAYICTLPAEEQRELINNKQEPECRSLPPAQQLERWELMRTVWEPGDAVMRIKTDIKHKNPAMRDWPAMRINTSAHPRQGMKYRAWPLMNFSVSVDDIELNMTHVLRAKDHADNAKRQEYIYQYFDREAPEVYFVGKINFTDLKLSTSSTRLAIDEGEYSGWDDIKLPFLPALKRRGYQPEAFLRLAEEMGISSTDKKISKEEYFTSINTFNRELIDDKADRLFFIEEPLEIEITNAPSQELERDLHPDHRKGGRTFKLTKNLIVDKKDLDKDESKTYRLMDAFNFKYENGEYVYTGNDLEEFRSARNKQIMHYLPADKYERAQLHYPDGKIVDGLMESTIKNYQEGQIIQLERIGFVRVDSANPVKLWFAHR